MWQWISRFVWHATKKGFTSELCSDAVNNLTHCSALKLLKIFANNHWWSFLTCLCDVRVLWGFFNLFCFVIYFESPLWVFKIAYAVVAGRSLWVFGPFRANCCLCWPTGGTAAFESWELIWIAKTVLVACNCNIAIHRAARGLWYFLPDFLT